MRHRLLSRQIRSISRCRAYSQKPPAKPSEISSGTTTQTNKPTSRIDRFISRSPKFLHKHLQSLRGAPVSHVTAFLVLHELTAIIPLFGLAGAFHYYNWLPSYFAEGAWVIAGVEKFGRYARRKGWISVVEEQQVEQEIRTGSAVELEGGNARSAKWFNRGEGGVRWVVEFATAYAIVKAFLIPRLLLSAWGAPWFARWTIIPIVNTVRRSNTKPAGQKVV